MMEKLWHDRAWDEYLYYQNQDKKTLNRINKLIKDIERNGYNCIGKPEKLKGHDNRYSLRIDKKNRLVFSIEGDKLLIFSCKTHYGEK